MTEFNVLQAKSDGQLYIHVHTERTTTIVAVSDRDLTDLRDALENPPESIDR